MVVQAPPHVVGVGLAPVAPPCIAGVGGCGLQAAVNVLEATGVGIGQQHVHPCALFGCEAAVFLIAAPVFQIFLAVGDVDVAAQHKFARSFQLH